MGRISLQLTVGRRGFEVRDGFGPVGGTFTT